MKTMRSLGRFIESWWEYSCTRCFVRCASVVGKFQELSARGTRYYVRQVDWFNPMHSSSDCFFCALAVWRTPAMNGASLLPQQPSNMFYSGACCLLQQLILSVVFFSMLHRGVRNVGGCTYLLFSTFGGGKKTLLVDSALAVCRYIVGRSEV